MKTKKDLRLSLMQKRIELESKKHYQQSIEIAERTLKLDIFKKAQTVACYKSSRKEVDTDLIMEQAFALQKKICLPKILSFKPPCMAFYRIDNLMQLQANRYGIPEPHFIEPQRHIQLIDIDLMIIPLLGFNSNGYRIGSGAGFYDRFLTSCQTISRPYLLGLAFEFQKSEFKEDSWDIALDGIITESKFHSYQKEKK